MTNRNTICLWYDGTAVDAARFYADTFPDSEVGAVLRATPRFVKGVIGATFGIAFMYLGVLVLNIFGVADGFWTSGSPLGIVISLVVVCVAALNLILDFDFIEKGVQRGLPRYMDWYGGFGLIVTLVWLYLEMLRLLARLRQ